MGYLLSWHVSKICWYKDKSAFFEKAISKPKSSTWHSHSTQIPFWSDEHTRNLKTVRRNKCCNNLKGGGKPTRHAELLFSTYWLDFFFFLKLLDWFPVVPFSACWRMKWALVKREVYGFKSCCMDWSGSSFVLRLCANHLPREFNSFKKIQLYFSVLCILGNVQSQLLFSSMKKSFVLH